MTQVELPWMPILCSIEPQETPLRSPSAPSASTRNFGTTNSEMPLRALRRAFDARQDEVDDVLGEVVLAGRDEDLRAGDGVGAVAVRRGLGLDQAEIGAAMRLGQVHGAGPAALDHLRQVGAPSAPPSRARGAPRWRPGQPRIHGEGHVGRRGELVHDGVEGIRQALAAVFGRQGEPHPAALRRRPRRRP